MNAIEIEQLEVEIHHIFDSGANELRIFSMVKNFIESRPTITKSDELTMRDKFAAKAMQSIISSVYGKASKESPDKILNAMELVTKNAYWFADNMLKERDKK